MLAALSSVVSVGINLALSAFLDAACAFLDAVCVEPPAKA